jgi:CRISPR-associated endonuclease/helicase Cas3
MKTVLGKPSGISLADHVAHVVGEAEGLLIAYPFVAEKYSQLSGGKNLAKWLAAAAKYHDDGKKHPKWQTACQLDHQAFLAWQARNGGSTFKQFEQKDPDIAGKNLRTSGLRHEIASVFMHKDHGFALPVLVAIAAHHAKLSIRFEERWKKDLGNDSKELWKMFRRASNEGLDVSVAAFHEFQKFLNRYPMFSGIRAWLMIADQRASGEEAGDKMPLLRAFNYQFPHPQKRNVQQIVEDYWADDFLLVRAPTGAGKTDAALLWAQKQIENGRASRLVIAMPTRFTSNALSVNVAESLSETGLYHSSAWFSKFQKAIDKGDKDRQLARNEHDFARKLLTPVTVCTIDHLLMALTLTREDHHQVLFNLMNACLVIDEADFYDEFTQANILVLLEALHQWRVPVMLMSASLPESSRTFYERSGYRIPEIREDKSDLTRERCRIDSIAEAETVEELGELLEPFRRSGTGIIYANTVARALEYYQWFEERDIRPILYHSRFIEGDKKAKEEELLAALGKKRRRQRHRHFDPNRGNEREYQRGFDAFGHLPD